MTHRNTADQPGLSAFPFQAGQVFLGCYFGRLVFCHKCLTGEMYCICLDIFSRSDNIYALTGGNHHPFQTCDVGGFLAVVVESLPV